MKLFWLKLSVIFLFAASLGMSATPGKAAPNLLPEDDQKLEDLMADNIKKKIRRGAYFLLGIDTKIQQYREDLKLLRNNIDGLETRIEETKVDATELASQLENLDHLIAQNQLKITAGRALEAEFENGIFVVGRDIVELEKTMKKELKALNETMTGYYFQTNAFLRPGGDAPLLLAFLAGNDSTGEIMKQQEYLGFLEKESESMAKNILLTQEKLDKKNDALGAKKQKLSFIQNFLEREERTLAQAQDSKRRLLDETNGKQAIYETLLELSKKEEAEVALSIGRLKENYQFFESKLKELESLPPEAKLPEISLENFEGDFANSTDIFSWPVSPSLGISAYFHDEGYRKALGLPHNAVDIRVAQGSKVKAAGNGVVTKVVDNGYAYSYVILAHPGNMLTLYGHLSDIFTEEGEIVKQGQAIGLSGGIPGTKGAGWLTTGAHLHFEVFDHFKHADPLEFLPIEYLPVGSLPEKYIKKLN